MEKYNLDKYETCSDIFFALNDFLNFNPNHF